MTPPGYLTHALHPTFPPLLFQGMDLYGKHWWYPNSIYHMFVKGRGFAQRIEPIYQDADIAQTDIFTNDKLWSACEGEVAVHSLIEMFAFPNDVEICRFEVTGLRRWRLYASESEAIQVDTLGSVKR